MWLRGQLRLRRALSGCYRKVIVIQRQHLVIWVVVACLAAALVVFGRFPGMVLAAALVGITVLVMHRPDRDQQLAALRTSIELSADEIREVLDEYERFALGEDAESIADRTLRRPALLNDDSPDEDIARFHFEAASARRFLHRLPARTADPGLTAAQLENLLSVTDGRALCLREAWVAARRAARRLGP